MKRDFFTPNVLNEMIINSINDIYQSKYLNNVKITNVGSGSNDAPDVAG